MQTFLTAVLRLLYSLTEHGMKVDPKLFLLLSVSRLSLRRVSLINTSPSLTVARSLSHCSPAWMSSITALAITKERTVLLEAFVGQNVASFKRSIQATIAGYAQNGLMEFELTEDGQNRIWLSVTRLLTTGMFAYLDRSMVKSTAQYLEIIHIQKRARRKIQELCESCHKRRQIHPHRKCWACVTGRTHPVESKGDEKKTERRQEEDEEKTRRRRKRRRIQ